MSSIGQTKIYKGNGKAGKVLTQFCIDGHLVDEVLKDLPKGITIFGAKVVVGKGFSKHKAKIPNRLRKYGVQQLNEHKPAYEAYLVFDQVTRTTIKKSIHEVSKALDLNEEAAYFKYLTLSNGKGTGKFERTTKEIRPDETDLRKKLTVLGLTDAEGKVQTLIAEISAKKYECQIKEVSTRTVICAAMS